MTVNDKWDLKYCNKYKKVLIPKKAWLLTVEVAAEIKCYCVISTYNRANCTHTDRTENNSQWGFALWAFHRQTLHVFADIEYVILNSIHI